jgi:hypothetical protein
VADRPIRHSSIKKEIPLIFAFIRSLIGSVGRAIMDFYIANSLLINSIILLYALLVFFARRNYYFILNTILLEAGVVETGKVGFKKSKLSKSDFEKIDWDLVKNRIKFPFLALPKKWTMKLVTKNELVKQFCLENVNELVGQITAKQE